MKRPSRFRPATRADIPALLALEAGFPGDRLSARQMRRHLAAGRHLFQLAEQDAELQAYILVLLRKGSDAARVYSLIVDPRWRGRGLARDLLQRAEDEALRRGCRRMRLEVRADNRPALALYQAAGYRPHARRAAYYDDGEDAVCMEKALPAP